MFDEQVTCLGIEELRFSREQVAELLGRVEERVTDRIEVDALLAETEGWPAGLVLATRSVRMGGQARRCRPH